MREGSIIDTRIGLPLSEERTRTLRAGERLLLNGSLYTGRDAAHRRLVETLAAGESLPVSLRDQVLYYVGPTPAPPGRVIGSAGPTTSSRMDPYTPRLLAEGLRGTIGKGPRSPEVVAALQQFGAVYFVATGGAGALLSTTIERAEIVAYHDLGPEAMYHLWVKDFPVIVAIDTVGGDLYQPVTS